MILTSTPSLNELKALKQKTISKGKCESVKRNLASEFSKKAKKVQKCNYLNTPVGSTDSDSDNVSYQDSSDCMEIEYSETSIDCADKQKGMTVTQGTLSKNDFVLVELIDKLNKTKKEFVAQIISASETENDTIEVKFMRHYRQHEDTFVFPDVDDVSTIEKEEILGKLQKYEKLRYGKIKFY